MSDIAVAESGTRLQNFLDRAGLRGFPWKTATILYTISWGWLLIAGEIDALGEPLYWRTVWTTDKSVVNLGFAPWADFLYTDFFDFVFPHFSEFVFLAHFVVGLGSFAIISGLKLLEHPQVKFFTLLILLVPFNTARISSMTIVYTCSLLTFVIAWVLLTRAESKVARLLTLILFFISFATHSLIFFYVLPLLHVFLLSQPKSVNAVIIWLRRNLLLFLPPLLYVSLRAVFWTDVPNYHDVSTTKLLNGLKFTISLLAVGLIILIFHQSPRFRNLLGFRTILIGLFASGFGSLAYLIMGFYQADFSFFRTFAITFVGRSAWLSRHQLLQAFGFALILVGLVQLVSVLSTAVAKLLKVAAIACCVFFSVCFGFEYTVDSQKQDRIIDALNESLENRSDLDELRNYVFVDQASLLNARGRPYKTSTYSIWLHQAKYRGDRKNLLTNFAPWNVSDVCNTTKDGTLVLIRGPETHWEALQNWVSDGDMGFKVTVDDTPGACKPEMVTNQRSSGAIPILFYFTGAKG
jgi:hypothetical protein